jgi:hypothetical protein
MNVLECIGGWFMMPEQFSWVAGFVLFAFFASLSKIGDVSLHEWPP